MWKRFGPWEVDRYAGPSNVTCPRFNALFDPVNVAIIGVVIAGAYALSTALQGGGPRGPMMTPAEAAKPDDPHVFFDMEVGGRPVGRIELQLFHSVDLRDDVVDISIGAVQRIDTVRARPAPRATMKLHLP